MRRTSVPPARLPPSPPSPGRLSPALLPPALQQGARVRVVAPSGPFDVELFDRGLRHLANFLVSVPPDLRGRQTGYLAGDDEVRLAELQLALDCPDAAAVLVARGGFGLGRIVDDLDLSGLHQHPKWVCGFSDATVLHQRLLSEGILSIHGPNVTTLATAEPQDLDRLQALLAGKLEQTAMGLDCWVPGRVAGPFVGGNLTVLFSEAAAGRLQLPPGALLFLEDVTETSYRLDRMLTSLARAGFFETIAGVVLGEFTDCSPGKFGVDATDVLRNFFSQLELPCVAGFPAGHGRTQRPFVHGQPAELEATEGRLRLDRP